jgi:translocation and assembly module TamB
MTEPSTQAEQPVPAPASQRHPLRAVARSVGGVFKSLGWLGVWLPGALVALLLAALVVVWVWSGTTGSLAQTIGWAQARTQDQPPEAGRLQATGVQGSLREGGQIKQLQWSQPGLTVQAQAVRLRWRSGVILQVLRGNGVQLEELAIGELRVQDERPPSPTVPLESLPLPMHLRVPWSLDRLVLTGKSPLELRDLKGLYRYDVLDLDSPPSQGLVPGVDAAHQLRLDSLQFAQGRYSAQLVLGALAPMPLKLSLLGDVKTTVPGGEDLTLKAAAEVAGTLTGTSATLQVDAQVLPVAVSGATQANPTLVASATVRPWASEPTQMVERVSATTDALDLSSLWPQAPRTALSGTLNAEPKDGAWQASARFDNRASGPWDQQRLPIESLQAAVEQRENRWVLPSLAARIGRGEIRARGAFQPAAGPKPATWEGDVTVVGMNPALAWSTLAPLALDAKLRASTSATRPDTIALDARVLPSTTQPSRAAQGLRLREVQLTGQWLAAAGRGGMLELTQAVVDAAGLRATAQGRVDVAASTFKGQAALNLPGAKSSFSGDIAYAQGSGDMSLNINDAAQLLTWARSLQTLPMAGPVIGAWLKEQPQLNTLQVAGSAQLDAKWQGGLAELGFPIPGAPAATASGAPLQLQVTLDVPKLTGNLPATPDSSATTTPTAKPSPWSVQGLRLDARGSLADLALKLQGEAALAPWSGSVNTQARVKNALVGMGLAASTPKAATSQLELAALQFQVQDASRPDRRVDWLVRSEQPLALSWTQTPAGLTLHTGPGRLQVLPTFQAFKQPGRKGALNAASLPASAPGKTPLTLAWDTIRWQGEAVETRGSLSGLPLSWIDALATAGGAASGPITRAGVRGDIVFNGRWDVLLPASGANRAPLRLNAQLQRASGDLSVQTEPSGSGSTLGGVARAPVQAGVRDARLILNAQGRTVNASLVWDSERLGQATAGVRTEFNLRPQAAPGVSLLDAWWPASSPIEGSLKATLPQVGVWSALAPPGWRMRGTLKAEATVGGTRSEPKLRGSLEAEELALRSVVDGIEFSNGRLLATLDDQRITIERLTLDGPAGNEPGGSLEAKGRAEWRAPTPGAPREPLIDLEVRTDKLRVSTRPDRRLTLSGEVKARLAGPSLTVRGKLTADSALFILPDELAPTLGSDVIVRGGRNPPPDTSTAVPIQPDIEVSIDLGEQFEVRGRGLKTRLAGLLTVRSTPQLPTPRVLGEVRTVGGTYRAYGQNLNIETGVLRFTGPYDDPTLDILAVRAKVGEGQRVGLQITGSAQSPRVRLYASPDLPDSEKLAYLVLGRPATGAGAEAAVLQQAAMALLSGGGGQRDGGIAKTFGLDELGFSGESTNADGSTTAAALTLGKRISDKLYLSYERSLAGTLGTVSIFYDVSKRLTLRARAGEESAIDLIFTIRYD